MSFTIKDRSFCHAWTTLQSSQGSISCGTPPAAPWVLQWNRCLQGMASLLFMLENYPSGVHSWESRHSRKNRANSKKNLFKVVCNDANLDCITSTVANGMWTERKTDNLFLRELSTYTGSWDTIRRHKNSTMATLLVWSMWREKAQDTKKTEPSYGPAQTRATVIFCVRTPDVRLFRRNGKYLRKEKTDDKSFPSTNEHGTSAWKYWLRNEKVRNSHPSERTLKWHTWITLHQNKSPIRRREWERVYIYTTCLENDVLSF